MSTNNKISTLISSQVPFFVRNDHEKFMLFLEAYYEYLEQSAPEIYSGKVVERAKNLQNYSDIDNTLDGFKQFLLSKFLIDFPSNSLADTSTILKNAKDLYRAKGTEKATRFLMRALFDKDIEFYYPKRDVLRASDGKWFIKKTLRIVDTAIDNSANTDVIALGKYAGTRIRGEVSNATATVETVERFYDAGSLIDELAITSVAGVFLNGENVTTQYTDNGVTANIRSTVVGGVINSITITNPGSGYVVGDQLIISSNTGMGANAFVSKVSVGNIAAITIVSGGAGYRVSDNVAITGGGGAGATANVANVTLDNSVHPNSYNLIVSTISSESNTAIGNNRYSNLSSTITDPANSNTIANVTTTFKFSNTGPVEVIRVITPGDGFTSLPSLGIVANTRIQEAGIIGRLEIVEGGSGYSNGDIIQFVNGPYSYGYGANANVTVNGTGSIIRTTLFADPGFIVGGSGYDQNFLPTTNVASAGGSGANIVVKAVLGYGAELLPANTTLGAIERVTITNKGVGYETAPDIDLSQSGDGLATAYSNVITGIITYPGRYLNDDGQPSSFNFLQDRDYYQNFSYVIRVEQSLTEFGSILKSLLHPAGMKLFSDYTVRGTANAATPYSSESNTKVYTITTATYQMLGNVVINSVAHSRTPNDRITLEFTTGNAVVANSNGEFIVQSVTNANSFVAYATANLIAANTLSPIGTGSVLFGRTVA